MTLHRTLMLGLVAWLSMLASCVVHAGEKTPGNWRADCVGRMQLSFPGDVEIAAMQPRDFIGMVARQGVKDDKFPDGQDAVWSDLDHFGLAHISHKLDSADAARLSFEIQQRWEDMKAFAQEQRLGKAPTIGVSGKAWREEDGYRAFLIIGSTALSWASFTDIADMPRVDAFYQVLIGGLRERATFDAPKEPGVCLPYLFVKDDGTPTRHVGMTYRLKDHPDITVSLKEGSALTIGPRMNAEKFTAKYKAYQFWMQRFQVRSAMRSLLPFDQDFLTTSFAGQRGVKTFVQLTSEDEVTQDLGYLIAVRGDPEAKEDKPDLMFAVLQNSINARKRGIEPLDKDAFYKLAETIAASVKRRDGTGR